MNRWKKKISFSLQKYYSLDEGYDIKLIQSLDSTLFISHELTLFCNNSSVLDQFTQSNFEYEMMTFYQLKH